MILKYLIQKELLQLRRDSFLPKMIVVYPIVIMLVMPWVMNLEVQNVSIDVVDNDHSTTSRRMVQSVESSHYFVFNGMRSSYAEALTDVERGKADIVMVIPPRYERDKVNGRQPEVLIAANAVNGTKGGIGSAYLAAIVQQNATAWQNAHPVSSSAMGMPAPIKPTAPVSTLHLYNPYLDYKVFMIPALMGVLMIMLCGFLPALNIVNEKEKGTIEQINVTPVSKGTFILAKLIPYWLIGMVVITACFIIAWLVYGITAQGNLLLVYAVSILLAFIFSGIGLVISNYSDTLQQSMFVMWFILVCSMLLSGLFTPVSSMPDWAQTLTLLNPVRHFIDGIRTVFVRGGNLHSIAPQLLLLAVYAAVMNVWAVISYRKNS